MEASSSLSPDLQRLDVELGPASYPILVGSNWLPRVGEQLRATAKNVNHALVVCDASIGSTFGEVARKSLKDCGVRTDFTILPSGEASKSVVQLQRLWDWMLECGADRKSVVVAVGGGVVGDVAGFAAATYQRGIRLVHLPTTLLAQVDSSVGGKTAVNLPKAKNMVGAFWQPLLVAIDTHTLGSLPQRDYLSGLAEVVKYGIIEHLDLFTWLESNARALVARDHDAIVHAVVESCRSKAAIVKADERETSGRRATLNYGHTFGHAIEATAGYGSFLHGEAVAIGMCMAAQCAYARGMFSLECLSRQRELMQQIGLPTHWPEADSKSMLASMMHDKKNESGRIRLVLPSRIGNVELVTDATEEEILSAIDACKASS